jgi:hypothetical protein
MTVSITTFCIKGHYAEYRRDLFIVMLNVIMLNVVRLSVVAPSTLSHEKLTLKW